LPAHRAPPADRGGGADVGPFGQIGLAQDHCALGAQQSHHRRIPPRHIGRQSQTARRGRHRVLGLDVILHQHGNAVQNPKRSPRPPPRIRRPRLSQSIRVHRDHRAQGRPPAIHRRDPGQSGASDRLAAGASRRHLGRHGRGIILFDRRGKAGVARATDIRTSIARIAFPGKTSPPRARPTPAARDERPRLYRSL
jgi:hypothetical protein